MEVDAIAGIASSLIAGETMRDSPIVVHGVGPRLRVYCLYGEPAIFGEGSSEETLAWCPTDGDWAMSLPCLPDDLDWVRRALARRSLRITARDWSDRVPSKVETNQPDNVATDSVILDAEAFLRP